MDEQGRVIEYEVKEATREDVIEHLVAVHKLTPAAMVINVLDSQLMRLDPEDRSKKVCPVGLFDYTTDWLVSLETAASKYHVLPFPGSYLQQPLYIIEAFDVCRAAEARWNNNKILKMKEKSNNKS